MVNNPSNPTRFTGLDVEKSIKECASPVKAVNDTPLVFFIDDFITSEEAKSVVAHADGKMKEAVVSGANKGVTSQGRTNRVAWIPHAESEITKRVSQRVADTIGLPLSHAENMQVINYQPGQEYRAHFDAFDKNTESGQRTMQKGGQRITTTLCYLNSTKKGGNTRFSKLDIEVESTQLRLLVFNNCEGDSSIRSKLSLHAGMPVELGEKWAFNLWFREYPVSFNPLA